MGNVAHDKDFTETSGVTCSERGEFSIGFEASYPDVSPPDGFWLSKKTVALPANVKSILIYGGSISLRPERPQTTGLFGTGQKAVYADGLFRVYFGGKMVVNRILKADVKVENMSIEQFAFVFREGDNRDVTVEFAEAGPGKGTSMELQLCGEWGG